jgi:sugar phosphate isomerase/epimerase
MILVARSFWNFTAFNQEIGIKAMQDQSGRSSMQPISMAMSPCPSVFAPLVFAGRLNEGIQALAQAGFNGIEISLGHASDIEADWLEKVLAETGLQVSAFASGRLCLEDNICLSDTNPVIKNKVFAELSAILKLAARFHAPVIIGGVRGKLTGSQAQKAEQRASAIENLLHCAQVAEDLGTHLLLEPINRYETNFINSAQDGLDLLEDVGHPAIKLLLDTFHMNIEEVDLCASIRKVGARLGYVHFADSNRLAPGQGHIDFPTLLRTLAEIGYRGFISAEILPSPDDGTALKQTGKYLHALINEVASY